MQITTKTLSLTLLITCWLGAVPSASATPVAFDFNGTVFSSPGGFVLLSTPFSGSFSYDDALAGSATANGTNYTPAAFTLNILGEEIRFPGIINVTDDSAFIPGADTIQVGFFGINPMPLINGLSVSGIELAFVDTTGTMLADEGLPGAFGLDGWTSRLLSIRFTQDTLNPTLGMLSSLSPSPVPVPAAVWLLGSALLGLVRIRRGKWGQSS